MLVIILQLPLIVQGISVIHTGIVELDYNITFSNHCQRDTHRIQVYHGGSIDDCVTECGLRVHCKAINYHGGAGICELFTETDTEFTEYGCSYIKRTDTILRKLPCYGGCDHGMVCDIDTRACVIKECLSFPVIPHGVIRGNLKTVGTKLMIDCDEHYVHRHDIKHTICTLSGSWKPAVECYKRAHCDMLATPQRSFVSTNNGTLDGDVTVYECLAGNVLVDGTLIRVCQLDSTWSGTQPVCKEKICVDNGVCFAKYAGTDLFGHDYTNVKYSTFEDCAIHCENLVLKSIVTFEGRCYCKDVTFTDGYSLKLKDSCDFYHKL